MNVSIILPVYNAIATLPAALESLRAQHLSNLEIVVINDGSTDGSEAFLHAQKDILLLNRPHEGIVSALNAGISVASGTYLARMDADDICYPQRIKKQAAFLNQNPHIGLVGSKVGFGGNAKKQAGYATYVKWINELIHPKEISLNRFVESPFAHPSVMFRRTLVEQFGGYRDGPFPEDYELWLRWLEHGVQMEKLNEELLIWNDPPTRLSRTDPRYDVAAFYQTKIDYLVRWLKKNNPHHPNVLVWGAGRITRKRAEQLQAAGIKITHYIDIKPRKLNCGTPVLLPHELPNPKQTFILPMVANRGARKNIRAFLTERNFKEGVHFLFLA